MRQTPPPSPNNFISIFPQKFLVFQHMSIITDFDFKKKTPVNSHFQGNGFFSTSTRPLGDALPVKYQIKVTPTTTTEVTSRMRQHCLRESLGLLFVTWEYSLE